MRKLIVDGKEMPFYAETVDGQDVYVFAARRDDDGGIVTGTLVPLGDGTVAFDATWRGRGQRGPVPGGRPGDADRDPVEVSAEKRAAQDEALGLLDETPAEELAVRVRLARLYSGVRDAAVVAEMDALRVTLAETENVREAARKALQRR